MLKPNGSLDITMLKGLHDEIRFVRIHNDDHDINDG